MADPSVVISAPDVQSQRPSVGISLSRVGVTGVAGPAGGTPDKPVGLVFHAVASDRGTEVIHRNFPGDRKRIRRFASTMALDMLRKKLM